MRADDALVDVIDELEQLLAHDQDSDDVKRELVRWNEAHVLAMVEIYESMGRFLKPTFSDASCWAAGERHQN